MKYSPSEVRAIKMSRKGQLPSFLQNTPRPSGKRVGAPASRESLRTENYKRARKGITPIRVPKRPILA